jgi:hypothetical protein
MLKSRSIRGPQRSSFCLGRPTLNSNVSDGFRTSSLPHAISVYVTLESGVQPRLCAVLEHDSAPRCLAWLLPGTWLISSPGPQTTSRAATLLRGCGANEDAVNLRIDRFGCGLQDICLSHLNVDLGEVHPVERA